MAASKWCVESRKHVIALIVVPHDGGHRPGSARTAQDPIRFANRLFSIAISILLSVVLFSFNVVNAPAERRERRPKKS
jgi:hypothetical protein